MGVILRVKNRTAPLLNRVTKIGPPPLSVVPKIIPPPLIFYSLLHLFFSGDCVPVLLHMVTIEIYCRMIGYDGYEYQIVYAWYSIYMLIYILTSHNYNSKLCKPDSQEGMSTVPHKKFMGLKRAG
jgi:hypothetical protein